MLQLLHNLSNDGSQQSLENNRYSCIYRHFVYPPGGLRVTPIWKSFISSFNIWHIIERNSLVLGRGFIYCGKMCLDMPTSEEASVQISCSKFWQLSNCVSAWRPAKKYWERFNYHCWSLTMELELLNCTCFKRWRFRLQLLWLSTS